MVRWHLSAGMFEWFKAPPHVDPELGELRRKSGMWRGEIAPGRFAELCGSVLGVP